MNKSFSRVLIKDGDGKILVVQDRENIWNFPGGKQEASETIFQCAKREVSEEIGIKINDLNEIHQGKYIFSGVEWTGHFFLANSAYGVPYLNEIDKIKEIRFIKEYEQVDFPEELLESVKSIFNHLHSKTESTNWH
jgi:8-oxo-dGTP diphosphatase